MPRVHEALQESLVTQHRVMTCTMRKVYKEEGEDEMMEQPHAIKAGNFATLLKGDYWRFLINFLSFT